MADDDDLFEDEEANTTIRDLRHRIKELEPFEKQVKKLEPEVNELRQFKAGIQGRERVSSAEKAFEAAGVPTGLADLFAEKHEGDITEEAVREWAEARGLNVKPTEPQPEPTPEPTPVAQAPTFTPTVAGQPPSPTKIARKEIDAAMKRDPVEGKRLLQDALAKGTIEWENPEGVAASMGGME